MKAFCFVLALIALSIAKECGKSLGKGCSNGYCCSYWGYCGTTSDYCGTGSRQCACDCKGSNPCVASSSSYTGGAGQTTTADEKTIWDTLYNAIGNKYGVAGLMGNLYAESGLVANNLQNTYNTKLGYTDSGYTNAVDGGSYSEYSFVHDAAGYGLAQWTYYSRKQNLYNYAKKQKTSIGNLSMQLSFLISEIKGYTGVWNTLKSATSVKQASNSVLLNFERPADQSTSVQNLRASYGQTYYDRYASGSTVTPTPTPTPVTPSCTTKYSTADLNIRYGPSTSYSKVKTIAKGTAVCVVSIDSNNWAKLSDGYYCANNYLTTTKPGPTPTPTPTPVSGSRAKVVGIMQNWVGIKEGSSGHHTIIDTYNSISPLPVGYKLKYSDAWCAGTVSAAFHKAGYDSIFPSECSCGRMIKKAKQMGIWQEKDSYVPSPGDCILYDWSDSTGSSYDNTGDADHVGMVEKVEGNTMTIIEGNYSNSVKRRTVSVNGSNIRGFVTPKFTDNSSTPTPTPTPTPSCTTKYSTADLNIRTGPSTNYSKVKTISKGTAVCVVSIDSNNWAKLSDGYYCSNAYLTTDKPGSSTPTPVTSASRAKVVGIMQDWVGIKEGSSGHHNIIDTYNSIKPLPVSYKLKYTDAWCAGTVSAAFHKAGYDSIFPSECSCGRMINKAKDMGIWQEKDSYVPSPGDCILYDWQDKTGSSSDNTGDADHVGMVEKVEGNTMTIIEGNYSNSVKRRTIYVNGSNIRGFVTPKFSE